jgi:outer membrane protein
MSAALLFRGLTRTTIFTACLLALPVMAQQGGKQSQPVSASTDTTSGAAAQSGTQTQAPLPNGPQPKSSSSSAKQPDYSKGKSYFPNPLGPYRPQVPPPAVFTNGTKLESMIQNGKIMLSMDDAIAMALADNLDIAIARYNLPLADTDLLRTSAGGSFSGAPSGLVGGTQGGGGIAATTVGGSTAGAAGVGAGASGVVQSSLGAGPPIDSRDPDLSAKLDFEHSIQPSTNTIITGGAASTVQNFTIANFTYTQGFAPGTLLTVTYNNQRESNNFLTLNPQLSSNFRVSIRQHLLQGFGIAPNQRFILIARNDKKITEQGFRQQIISTVSQIQDIYWDLVAAFEDLKVKEQSLTLSRKTLSDNKKQVEIGTLAPIEIVRAQSQVAQDEQNLLTAQTQLQLQQLFMKSAITRDMKPGSPLMDAEVVPTDTVVVPDQEAPVKVEDLIQTALANRPDYIQQKIGLDNKRISIKGANNALLPTLDIVGFYGASSLAGDARLPFCVSFSPPTPPGCNTAGFIPPNGYSTTFHHLFNGSAPDKGVAFQLDIPIRNRVAQATQIRSQLEFRQAELLIRQFENSVAIVVRNDQFALEQDRARVVAAREAQRLAAQSLDAEQKKYSLGASTFFNVLSAQSALATAEENVVSAEIAYAKQRVTLDRDTGLTLEHNNIKLDEALSGNIVTQPNVPGLGPNMFLNQKPAETPKPPQ